MALSVDPVSYGSLLSSVLLSKIPQEFCLIISQEVPQENWEFEAILMIIEREIEAKEMAIDSSVTKKLNARNSTTASLLGSGTRSDHGTCCYCKQDHQPAHCM